MVVLGAQDKTVPWVVLVAPEFATVVSNPFVNNLEALKLFVTVLHEYNKGWEKRKVTDCSILI